MKTLRFALLGAVIAGMGILSGLALSHHRPKAPELSAAQTEARIQSSSQPAETGHKCEAVVPVVEASRKPVVESAAVPPVAVVAAGSTNSPVAKAIVDQAIGTLCSPQASHEQKQAAWKQLQDAGGLDQAIAELEQRAISDPRSPETAAALGQAYLKKCATLKDVREQGILAMQADKVFDTALSLDAANWDARFTKAVALSYWPPNMNKGEEVIQHFETLIEQQEAQQPQPQFAATYAWLGDQYKKAGRADDARMIWQRGSGFFPNNPDLRTKLSSAQ